MVTRAEVVAEARSWIGTRWMHQSHQKGIGVDCVGLVYAVGLGVGVLPQAEGHPEAERFAGYARRAGGHGRLAEACSLALGPINIDDMGPGDVALMRFNSEPQHLCIIGDYLHGGLSLIHAYVSARQVVEHRLDEAWRNRLVSAHRYPGLA